MCVRVCICVCCVFVNVYTCVHAYVCVYLCMSACVCMCVYVCVCVCVCAAGGPETQGAGGGSAKALFAQHGRVSTQEGACLPGTQSRLQKPAHKPGR